MEEVISLANTWANSVWEKVSKNWEDRNQDHNYRDILVRPDIFSALKSVKPRNGRFLDFGCGDGSETLYIQTCLELLGFSGELFGYDPQNHLIALTKRAKKSSRSITTEFGSGSIKKFVSEQDLENKVDLVTSTFVLHDIPNISKYLADVNRVLKKADATGLFILVHPEFGEVMKEKGVLNIKHDLSPKNAEVHWQFACEYPIVEENGKTFFVPYFQRTVKDYELMLKTMFKRIELRGIMPSQEAIKKCRKEHISPFCKHVGNVYYPEITTRESALVIIARR